jgi:hypothetical protein
MLSSTDVIWWFLIIVTDAAGGRRFTAHEPLLAARLLREGIAGPADHGNAARTDPILTIGVVPSYRGSSTSQSDPSDRE